MTPGIYDFPTLKRGDTFKERLFVEVARDGVLLLVTAARMQVRDVVNQKVLLEWSTEGESISLSGDPVPYAVTLSEKAPDVTASLPPGIHVYDLEVTLDGLGVVTVLEGKFPVSADISR